MKIWKFIPLLAIVFTVSSCASNSTDETATAADSSSTDPATDTTPGAPKGDAPAKTPKTAPVEKIETLTIPAGTEVTVILSNSLNSGKSKAGDEFEGGLALPVQVNGKTVLDKGAKVVGKVVDAEGSARVKGLASMRLTLTSVSYNGKMVPISTNPFAAEAESTKGRDAAVVGGAAGVGAVIGAIAGGGKGAATGAAIGGAAGGGTVLATKGKEVDFPAESKIAFTLADPLTVKR